MKNHTLLIATGFICGIAGSGVAAEPSTLKVTRLRCEYLVNPLGVDTPGPRLSWVLESDRRRERQTAYQVLVASSREKLDAAGGDLWDSGKVASAESVHVAYNGRFLASGQRAFWRVRVWDRDDRPSAWSEPAWWEMGLLNPSDWRARWISAEPSRQPATQPAGVKPAPHLRKVFTLAQKVKSARAYVAGLGYYELYFNGRKVGDHVLDPAFTRYDKRVLYAVYDVTEHLHSGDNAVGVILGNGWFNFHPKAVWNFDKAPWRDDPMLILQMEVTYEDGARETIVSDQTWRTAPGPIVFDGLMMGETYDARRERPGWATADYRETDWRPAYVRQGPAGRLVAQVMPPIKVTETLRPARLTKPKPGVYLYDMGQAFAGWAQLSISGPAGTRVTLKYGERLNPDGTLNQDAIKVHIREQRFQTDEYILKGQGAETWEPRFNYHGFQYVQVTLDSTECGTGVPPAGTGETPVPHPSLPKLTIDNLRGRVVHTAFEPAGTFTCSNELLNRIQHATLWSYRSNFHGYPTDCPHREKNGWTGDAHLAAEQAMFNFNNVAGYEKWLNDFDDEQRPSGELPGIVPTSGWGYQWGNGPAWDSAYLLIPWYLYVYYGDRRVLEQHDPGMKRYVDYLTSRAKDHLVDFGLGDWVCLDQKTPVMLTSSAYYYTDASVLRRAGQALWPTFVGPFSTEDLTRIKQLTEQGRNPTLIPRTSNDLQQLREILEQEDRRLPQSRSIVVPTSTMPAAEMKRILDQLIRAQRAASRPAQVPEEVGPLALPLPGGMQELRDRIRRLDNMPADRPPPIIPLGPSADIKKALDQIMHAPRAVSPEDIWGALNRRFLPEEFTGTQTGLSCALYQGVAPDWRRAELTDALVANIEREKGHLNCGVLGVKYLLHALTDGGRADLAYRIVAQKTYPGWGYWIEQGATTLWEDWKGESSRLHIMFGDVSAWFYQALAGINPDPDYPGFERVMIYPHPVGDLTSASATYNSIRGRIVSAWTRENGRFTLDMTIPPNVIAKVYVPAEKPDQVREGEQPADRADGVVFTGTEEGCCVYTVGSGRYRFTVGGKD